MPQFPKLGRLLLPAALLVAPAAFPQYPEAFPGQEVTSLAHDASGNFFAAGGTSDFPTTPGTYMPQHTGNSCQSPPGLGTGPQYYPCGTGFVAKFSPSGNIVWATYLGAPIDEGDVVVNIALDPQGNVWIGGYAGGKNFPITPNAYQSAYSNDFLAELSSDGSQLLYSTFLDTPFLGFALTLARQDGLYFLGNGVVKFNPSTNKIVYSALKGLLGLAGGSVLEDSGTLYLASATTNPDFPITPGAYSHPSTGHNTYNAVFAALDPSGNLVFATKLGGSGDNGAAALARDADGNFYLSGGGSAGFPVTSDAAQPTPVVPVDSSVASPYAGSPFIMKLSADASTLLYSSFISAELCEMKVGEDGAISGLGYTYAPFTPDGYYPCFPSVLGYVQLTADHPAIKYSTGIPTNTNYGYPTVFDFDTNGIAYFVGSTQPGQYFSAVDVSKAPHSGPICMAELASNFETSVAPGLLVSIYGPGVGPDQPMPLALDGNGRVATQLAGTQVLFDGIPAPILSAAPARVDVVVPFGVATSGNTTVSVLRNGSSVGTLTYPLTAQSLWFFTADGTGQGSPVINQDGTPNSAENPAKVGDTVSLLATGAGAMMPSPVDGTIPVSPQSTISHLPSLGPFNCPVTYAGDAPGLVEGIVQINCTIGCDGFVTTPGVYTFDTAASYTERYAITYRVYVTQ